MPEGIDKQATSPDKSPSPSDAVELYRAANVPEAHAIRLALAAVGISAWIENETLQGALGELPIGWDPASCSPSAACGDFARRW